MDEEGGSKEKNGKGPKNSNPPKINNPPKNNDKRKHDEGGSYLVAATSRNDQHGFKNQRGQVSKGKYTREMVMDQPCRFHSTSDRPSTHTNKVCYFLRGRSGDQSSKDDKGDKDKKRSSRRPRAVFISSLASSRGKKRSALSTPLTLP